MSTLFLNEVAAICVASRAGGAFASAVGFVFADAVKCAGASVNAAVFDSAESALVHGNAVSADFSGNGRAVFIQLRSDLVQGLFEFKTGGNLDAVGKSQMF